MFLWYTAGGRFWSIIINSTTLMHLPAVLLSWCLILKFELSFCWEVSLKARPAFFFNNPTNYITNCITPTFWEMWLFIGAVSQIYHLLYCTTLVFKVWGRPPKGDTRELQGTIKKFREKCFPLPNSAAWGSSQVQTNKEKSISGVSSLARKLQSIILGTVRVSLKIVQIKCTTRIKN